jgi:Domain of unknown function (DUF4266)
MKSGQRRRLWSLVALVICAGAGGCATVKPWDRDLLAKPEMQFVTCAQLHAIDEHVYFSKEASMGGSTLSGGGCGCN